MKKLFGRDKPKPMKPPSTPPTSADTPTPIHSVFASQNKPNVIQNRPNMTQHQHSSSRNSIRRSSSSSPERTQSWEVIDDTQSTVRRKQQPPALAPQPPPTVVSSVSSGSSPAALGILRALDPHNLPVQVQTAQMQTRQPSVEPRHHYSQSDTGHDYNDDRSSINNSESKRKFWERSKEKDQKPQQHELREAALRERDREYREGKERELRLRENELKAMEAELREREAREAMQREREENEQKAMAAAAAANAASRGHKEHREHREHKEHRDRDRDRDREREHAEPRDSMTRSRQYRDRDEEAQELTRMIGYLTATASEDWTLVLEVCDRASVNDTAAKEAVKALRREFKYGDPPAQLSAARLWAIMLRNSSTPFIAQSTSRKFLDTLEDLLNSPRTVPVVRERVLDVVAAAAFASQGSGGKHRNSGERDGFKGLWKRVKPADKPDEGMPFDNHDAMFNPPISRNSATYDVTPPAEQGTPPDISGNGNTNGTVKPPRKHKSSKNRIIPVDEDIRRLFQECTIAVNNAQVLSQALTFAKPEEVKKGSIISEFYQKSKDSETLIFTQIPWATAGAERSRVEKDAAMAAATPKRPRPLSHAESPTEPITFASNPHVGDDDEAVPELTREEQLLGALLGAHEQLISAIRVYDDLKALAEEKQVQNRSKKDIKMDRRELQDMNYQENGYLQAPLGGGSSSRTPSESPPDSPVTHTVIAASPIAHPKPVHSTINTNIHAYTQGLGHDIIPTNLAPPPQPPIGPRSPTLSMNHSRTPSPNTPGQTFIPSHGHTGSRQMPLYSHSRNSSIGSEDSAVLLNSGGLSTGRTVQGQPYHDAHDDDSDRPAKPSAKALGKRKVVASVEPPAAFEQDNLYEIEHRENFLSDGANADSDEEDEDGRTTGIDKRFVPSVRYIYDAAAERTQQRILEGRLAVPSAPPPINGVLSH